MESSTIRLLVTGGTFDKHYNEIDGTLTFKATNVLEVLARGRCRIDTELDVLMMKDSLEMTDADRALIVDAARRAKEDRIVVTHGTDTMVETAKALAAAKLRKTIVMTGAMIPFVFGSSDGLFNLGSALSFVQTLPPGVYVAMNGRCFAWDNVRKNRALGIFEQAKAQ